MAECRAEYCGLSRFDFMQAMKNGGGGVHMAVKLGLGSVEKQKIVETGGGTRQLLDTVYFDNKKTPFVLFSVYIYNIFP